MSEDVYVNWRGERQMEMQGRGERTQDFYVTPNDQDRIYGIAYNDFDPGTQQDAVQKNTAQEQHGDCASIKEKNNLQSSFDQMQIRHDNMTVLKEQWKTRVDTLLTRLNLMTEQKDKLQTRFDQLQARHDNLDDLKRIICESHHGFTFGGRVCYYISTERRTWEESRIYCTDRQSDLMTIKSKEKMDFVLRFQELRLWLGLGDRESEGWMKWVDGTPLTAPTFWRQNNPDNWNGEDCVEFLEGTWNDMQCSRHNQWICEILM